MSQRTAQHSRKAGERQRHTPCPSDLGVPTLAWRAHPAQRIAPHRYRLLQLQGCPVADDPMRAPDGLCAVPVWDQWHCPCVVYAETLHVSKPTWWLESRFHFSFADYWDEARSSFGALRVVNDDLVKARSGFGCVSAARWHTKHDRQRSKHAEQEQHTPRGVQACIFCTVIPTDTTAAHKDTTHSALGQA